MQNSNIDGLDRKRTCGPFKTNPDLKVAFNDPEFDRGPVTINKFPVGVIDRTMRG
jgi:hypothetical protein